MDCFAFARPVLMGWSLMLAAVSASADLPDVTLKEGDQAPEFEAPTVGGGIWKSADHVGKGFVVVYFYPADLTGGCTKQACAFRDHRKELEEAGVVVVGVSGDSVKNHELFAKAHSLNFPLLADEEGRVARAFGVPVKTGATITKSVDGVEYSLTRGVTISRWTFVVGPDGSIVHKDSEVNPEEDCRNVLKIVRRLKSDVQ